jgi:hypothetical protein
VGARVTRGASAVRRRPSSPRSWRRDPGRCRRP